MFPFVSFPLLIVSDTYEPLLVLAYSQSKFDGEQNWSSLKQLQNLLQKTFSFSNFATTLS